MAHSPSPALTRALILASTSRYRRELLARLRLPFETQAPPVDETPLRGEAPLALALRLAQAKAQTVAARQPQAVVIGADQTADLDGEHLAKPGGHAQAVLQLRRMRARRVAFHSAVSVVCRASGFARTQVVTVQVLFRALSEAEIERYLRAEQPYDCAGSAKSEGLGISLLESIHSDDPTALIGLPLIATCQMLRAAGVQIP